MRRRRCQQFGASIGANPFSSTGEDVNPNAYLTNLSDCMLVLACGLMVALVVAWSVKLPSTAEIEQVGEMREVSNLEDITGEASGSGNGYNELGMVYQDPKTGKMYLIQDVDGEAVEAADSISQTGTSDVPKAGVAAAAGGEGGE